VFVFHPRIRSVYGSRGSLARWTCRARLQPPSHLSLTLPRVHRRTGFIPVKDMSFSADADGFEDGFRSPRLLNSAPCGDPFLPQTPSSGAPPSHNITRLGSDGMSGRVGMGNQFLQNGIPCPLAVTAHFFVRMIITISKINVFSINLLPEKRW
jgi:hypothetical protein